MPEIDANEFLMSSGVRSASLKNVGDHVVGHIIRRPEVRQRTNFDTGEPLFWSDGKPQMQLVVVLMTEESDPTDPEDSGERALYAKGNMLNAIRAAVRQSGAKGLEVGGKLLVEYTGDGVATRRGLNPPKLYEARYRAPKDEPVPVPEAPEPVAATTPARNSEIPF